MASQLLLVKGVFELFESIHAMELQVRVHDVVLVLLLVIGDFLKLLFGFILKLVNLDLEGFSVFSPFPCCCRVTSLGSDPFLNNKHFFLEQLFLG
jgi:hypothetical protein